MEANPTLDTLKYWITDTALIAMDTLQLAVSYMRPDSLERMTLSTDTLRTVLKMPRASASSSKSWPANAPRKPKRIP